MKRIERNPSKSDIIGRLVCLFIFLLGFLPGLLSNWFAIGEGFIVLSPIYSLVLAGFLCVPFTSNTGKIKYRLSNKKIK